MAGVFACPESALSVVEAIAGAGDLSKTEQLELKRWPRLQIVGFKVDDLGYAIAVGKPAIPTVKIAIEEAVERIQTLGLSDTIGWATCNKAEELSRKLRNWNDGAWQIYSRRRNHTYPLFVRTL
jgi:hypothetical protein